MADAIDYEYRLAVAYQIVGTLLHMVGDAVSEADAVAALDYLSGKSGAPEPLPFPAHGEVG